MSLRRLKWLSIVSPIAFLALLEIARALLLPDLFSGWPGYVLLAGIFLIGTLFFSEAIFAVIDRTQGRLEQKNRELLALHEANLDIAGELDLETVLQDVVERARTLLGARYGALSFLREREQSGIEAFLTSGITPEQRLAIGPLPEGRGLLGVVLQKGERLREADLTRHPDSIGFPPHHPPMHSLLAVPIIARGRILGNLYVTEKEHQLTFDTDDEETLERFATQAALAIENARLHRQVHALAVTEERERIAREIHDSVAQVLGYVNTKAQAAEELLKVGQPDLALTQIQQLGQAARDSYADVREHILGLRATAEPGRAFIETVREYLQRWQEQSGVIVELITEPPDSFELRLSATAELQLLRIIQEALANVRKHAAAARATVRLTSADGWVEARIEDDGIGFNERAGAPGGRLAFPRFGLATMRERAEAVRGTLAIESAAGQGTTVTVRIPEGATVSSTLMPIRGKRRD